MESTAVTLTDTSVSSSYESALDQLNSEDFFELLISELQQQDPLEPTDTSDMISQVSQIRSIEQAYQLTNTLEQLASQQHTAGTTELLGKYVQAVVEEEDGSETSVEGVVTGVRFDSDGSAMLELDTGQTISAEDVVRISTLESSADSSDA